MVPRRNARTDVLGPVTMFVVHHFLHLWCTMRPLELELPAASRLGRQIPAEYFRALLLVAYRYGWKP